METPISFALLRKIQANKLTELDLSNESVKPNDVEKLAKAMKRNSSLTSLKLSYNKLGAEGAITMARILEQNSFLTSLDFNDNAIGNKGATAFAQSLQRNSSLTSLDLGKNMIGPEGAAVLARSLERNPALSFLGLLENKIGAEGATALARSLERSSSLTTLDLGTNAIGSGGAEALARSLERNTSLTLMRIDYNFLSADGATALAQSLKQNSSLVHLDLSENKIGNEGATALARSLERNSTLNCLGIFHGYIGPEGAEALAQSLERNSTLTSLHISDNKIGDMGAAALARLLERNSYLTSLDISANDIGNNGGMALALSLERNTSLRSLNIDGNDRIQDPVMTAIMTLVERNKASARSLRPPHADAAKPSAKKPMVTAAKLQEAVTKRQESPAEPSAQLSVLRSYLLLYCGCSPQLEDSHASSAYPPDIPATESASDEVPIELQTQLLNELQQISNIDYSKGYVEVCDRVIVSTDRFVRLLQQYPQDSTIPELDLCAVMGLFDNVTDEWMATEVFAEKLRQVREYAMAFLSAMSRLPEALEQFLSTCLSPYTRYLLKNSQFAFELLHALTRHLDTDDIRWICKNATRDEFSEIASSPELNNLLEQTFASWGTSALPEETKRGALKTICLLTWPDLPRPYFPPNFLAGKVGSALLTRLFKSCEEKGTATDDERFLILSLAVHSRGLLEHDWVVVRWAFNELMSRVMKSAEFELLRALFDRVNSLISNEGGKSGSASFALKELQMWVLEVNRELLEPKIPPSPLRLDQLVLSYLVLSKETEMDVDAICVGFVHNLTILLRQALDEPGIFPLTQLLPVVQLTGTFMQKWREVPLLWTYLTDDKTFTAIQTLVGPGYLLSESELEPFQRSPLPIVGVAMLVVEAACSPKLTGLRSSLLRSVPREAAEKLLSRVTAWEQSAAPPEAKLCRRFKKCWERAYKLCNFCGALPSGPPQEINPRYCGGCRLYAYCNEACQKAHWKAGHRKECAWRKLRTSNKTT